MAVRPESSSSQCCSLPHREVCRRLGKSLLPRRRNPSVLAFQLTISRNALRVSDERARSTYSCKVQKNVRTILVSSQMKKNQSTVKDTHVQDTLTKPPGTKNNTRTPRSGAYVLFGPKPWWQAHLWPTTACVSKHEELWAILQHANARAGSSTQFLHPSSDPTVWSGSVSHSFVSGHVSYCSSSAKSAHLSFLDKMSMPTG